MSGQTGHLAAPGVPIQNDSCLMMKSCSADKSCHTHARTAPFSNRPAGNGKAGWHLAPSCEHGKWSFAGSDAKRGAAKYRCPKGECSRFASPFARPLLEVLISGSLRRWRPLVEFGHPPPGGAGKLESDPPTRADGSATGIRIRET